MSPEISSILQLANSLSRANEHLKVLLHEVAGVHGLQKSDFDVLSSLHMEGDPYRLTPKQLSQKLLFSSGGLTKVLHRLTESGLIQRDAGNQDGREKGVKLTPLGTHVSEILMAQLAERQQLSFSHFSSRQLQQLDKLLERLVKKWDNDSASKD